MLSGQNLSIGPKTKNRIYAYNYGILQINYKMATTEYLLTYASYVNQHMRDDVCKVLSNFI